ncbi:MAG: hypothetical protein QM778_18935 [Myxococcales bacterium]
MSRCHACLAGLLVILSLGCQPDDDASVDHKTDRYPFNPDDPSADAGESTARDEPELDGGRDSDGGSTSEADAQAPDASHRDAGHDGEMPTDDAGATGDGDGDPGAGLDGGDRPTDEEEEPGGLDAGEDAERDADVTGDAGTDAGNEEPSPPATFTRVFEIFSQQCRGCHRGGSQFSLDLGTKATAYDELIGGPSKGAAEFITCANQGYFRVVPGKPDESLLIQKLEGIQPCGDQMPPGKALSAAQLREVRSWIMAGALNN